MTKKVIMITERCPRNHTEKSCYGGTNIFNNVAEIFINKLKNRRSHDLVDTIFHEVTHAIVSFGSVKLSNRREESLCRAVGKAVAEVFRNA